MKGQNRSVSRKILAAAVLAAALGAAAPASAATISGTVTDAKTGKPVIAAQVSAIQTGTKNPEVKGSTDSDTEGKFVITDVPDGSYVVTATIQGYRPGSQAGVTISADTPATVGIQLTRSPY